MESDSVGGIEGDGRGVKLGLFLVNYVDNFFVILVGYIESRKLARHDDLPTAEI